MYFMYFLEFVQLITLIIFIILIFSIIEKIIIWLYLIIFIFSLRCQNEKVKSFSNNENTYVFILMHNILTFFIEYKGFGFKNFCLF